MAERLFPSDIRSHIIIPDDFNYHCLYNAVYALWKLRKLGEDGRVIWVNHLNHAYLVPLSFPPEELAINPPIRVAIDYQPPRFVQFDDQPIGRLLEMLDTGEAIDITSICLDSNQTDSS